MKPFRSHVYKRLFKYTTMAGNRLTHMQRRLCSLVLTGWLWSCKCGNLHDVCVRKTHCFEFNPNDFSLSFQRASAMIPFISATMSSASPTICFVTTTMTVVMALMSWTVSSMSAWTRSRLAAPRSVRTSKLATRLGCSFFFSVLGKRMCQDQPSRQALRSGRFWCTVGARNLSVIYFIVKFSHHEVIN